MSNQTNIELVCPQSRIAMELGRLESHKREIWVLVVFAGLVLTLGVLSFFFPHRFWEGGGLQLSLPPQVLFVIMVGTVLVSLFHVRRDSEVRGLRLANIQQHMRSQEEQAHGMIDPVTNVLARSVLDEVLAGEISRAESTQRPLTLIMCDMNNFKQVNDRYGHLIGDYVLSQVANILKFCVRGSDYIVRYGGDEFLVLLPDTDREGGEVVRWRVHRKIAEWELSNRVGELPVSISLGLHVHVTGQTAKMDIAEADARMYAEKRTSQHGTVTKNSALAQ